MLERMSVILTNHNRSDSMISPAYCQTMARYNSWMNDRLYAVCAEIPDAQRKTDIKLFFSSIHSTLNHLLHVDMAWLSSFKNERESIPQLALGANLYEEDQSAGPARVSLGAGRSDGGPACGCRPSRSLPV